MGSKMLSGTPILTGDSTIPGVKIHAEVKALITDIEKACRELGLTYAPIVIEFVRYDEISELASYGGFPVRYPHWRWGQEYEELSRGYEFGRHRISEMVVNTDPSQIYVLDSNTLVDNIDVIAHAIGHNDFFTNNVFFEKTNRKMLDKLANHGSRIRKYMARWGKEKVTEFIDHVLRLDPLIDPSKAWEPKVINDVIPRDERRHHEPNRLTPQHNYMEDWVNPKDYREKEKDKAEKKEAADYLDLFKRPSRDIFGYLKDHAPMKPWQQDIMSMLYEEALYFAPQRQTKMLNEGWASYVDFCILCRMGLVSAGQPSHDGGIWEYAKHKMLVLGGQWSQNPYKLGYELLLDIEDRWNKGKFGPEYEECKDIKVKEKWDKKLGLGKDKVFEVRRAYNDYTALSEFFTPEFCQEKQFYEYRKFPNGEWKIVSRDFKTIKKNLLRRRLNGGLPDVRLADPNHLNRGWMFLQHYFNELVIYEPYARETLASIWKLWNNIVVLATEDSDNHEFVYVCDGPDHEKNVHKMLRKDYEKEFVKCPEIEPDSE
jgi:stage V sporulation protein R